MAASIVLKFNCLVSLILHANLFPDLNKKTLSLTKIYNDTNITHVTQSLKQNLKM